MFKKKPRKQEELQLQMTPMIDVVFQLLIFFIVTLKQEDILSRLNVQRMAPDVRPPPDKKEDELLTIMVYRDGFVLQGARVSLATLERHLGTLASYNEDVSVIIKCTGDSPHARLIQLLDVCAKVKLTNLSVFSM